MPEWGGGKWGRSGLFALSGDIFDSKTIHQPNAPTRPAFVKALKRRTGKRKHIVASIVEDLQAGLANRYESSSVQARAGDQVKS